jgi:hypothetical protein
MPQNIDVAVIGANLEEDVIGAVPLVENFLDHVRMSFHPETNGPLIPFPPGIALHLHLHSDSFSRIYDRA